MKNLICIIYIMLSLTSCKAQQIQPLFTNLFDVVQGAYLKDTENVLDQYVGVYQTTFNNKITTLYITKELYKQITYPNKNHYQDVLIVKFIVKNDNAVLQNTLNCSTNCIEIESLGDVPQIQSLAFSNAGNNCGIGDGLIYIKKINANQISWSYTPQSVIYDDISCPPSIDKNIYLPVGKNIIFSKQ